MIYCKVFKQDLSNLSSMQIEDRCKNCLENNGEECSWMEIKNNNVMIQPIVYTVKSHKRVDRFEEKTYNKIILKYGFELSKVYVFVSTQEDLELYSKKYPLVNIVLGPLGVAEIDNFITDYFDVGQKIIYMNDDLSAIYELSDQEKFKELTKSRLSDICDAMFNIMSVYDITYGGFYPVMNDMFMKNSSSVINTGLKLIMDPFSLVINNKKIIVTISDKSDFEKSILHFIDKQALLRLNTVTFKAEYYGTKGGFQGRDAETEYASAKKLMDKYQYYVNGINVKKLGRTSLKLKPIDSPKQIKRIPDDIFDPYNLISQDQQGAHQVQASLF